MLEVRHDNEVHVEKVEQRPADSIAFGLERLGLFAVKVRSSPASFCCC